MEINSFKQPELVALIEKELKGKSSRYDVRPREEHLSVTDQTSMMGNTKHINYQDLQPKKIYALKTTTTDLQTSKQDTSFNLFLDRKMAETYYFQNTPKDNLILNHQVQHGIIISGDVNNDLLARLQMAPKDFNSMLVVSTMQADSFTNTQKQQIEQASKIAEKVFNEIPLKNEYAFDTLAKGAQQDLYKYYEMTHGENRQITHVDAWAIQERKEAVVANEPYAYVGLIHSKDRSTPSIAYINEHEYLNAIEQGLKNNPQNLGYETISVNPHLHKQVEDLVYKSYGVSNPNPIEYYTQSGREPIDLNRDNHPQISIMELAKALGFTYQGLNSDGEAMMKQNLKSSLNPNQETNVFLTIKNPDNPTTNYVDVDYISKSKLHPIVQDTDLGLTFKDFVSLTKPLYSEEIVRAMERDNNKEIVGTITYKDTNEKMFFASSESYVAALRDAIDNQPENFKYKTLSNDLQLKEQIKDIMYDILGMEKPIKIMDFAKEIGFSYEGKDNLLGDVVMRYKYDYENGNGKKEFAHVALSIKNPDDPEKNTVNIITTFFDENHKTIGTYYDNNKSFDQFVEQMKSLGSKEASNTLEQKTAETNSQQNTIGSQQQYNVETQPINSFKYETASILPQKDLINSLQDKFKLDTDTIARFYTFMEAAHPIDKPTNDRTQDTVVFPYVKVNNVFNLESHIYSTMSSTFPAEAFKARSAEDYVGLNKTNLPIGYERYTQDQTIPVKPYTIGATIEGGVWMATEAQKPNQVKDVFLFNSAVDAMSFYELHKNSIDLKNTALISVGNLARENQIYGVVERFPEAQLHTAFQNTLLGQLSTITAASIATIGPVKFKTDETKNTIEFTTYYDKFSLPIKDINLQNFKEHAHIKDKGVVYDLEKDLKIHSPQGHSYNEDLVQSKQQSEKQEQHRTMKL